MQARAVNKYREAFDVYIGRGSMWGNPYVMANKSDVERHRVIQLYKLHLNKQIESGDITRADLESLRGKRLGCFCKPKSCHGDYLAEIVNNLTQEQTMPGRIEEFQGVHRFLSNFAPSPITYKYQPAFGEPIVVTSPTVEHAYQAYKAATVETFEHINAASSPDEAKRRGRRIDTLRNKWDEHKLKVMKYLVLKKFTQNEALAQKLLATGDMELVEGNDWNDTFWGVCRGRGENHLGKILMEVRESIRNG